jgi:uncharacterized repeat protein (TIGR01451 family)
MRISRTYYVRVFALACGIFFTAVLSAAPVVTVANTGISLGGSSDGVHIRGDRIFYRNANTQEISYYNVSSGQITNTGVVAEYNNSLSPSFLAFGNSLAYEEPYTRTIHIINLLTLQDFNTQVGTDPYRSQFESGSLMDFANGRLVYRDRSTIGRVFMALYDVATGTSSRIVSIDSGGYHAKLWNDRVYFSNSTENLSYYDIGSGTISTVAPGFRALSKVGSDGGNFLAFLGDDYLPAPSESYQLNIFDTATGTRYTTGEGAMSSFAGQVDASGRTAAATSQACEPYFYKLPSGPAIRISGYACFISMENDLAAYGDYNFTTNSWDLKYARLTTVPTVISIASPAAVTYILNQQVLAQYSCSQGVLTCEGTVANNQYVDTASLGVKTFTVSSADIDGTVTTKTVSYDVVRKPAAGTASADLALTMSSSATKQGVPAGSLVTYVLGVSNKGPDTATGVTLVDDVPAGANFVSATGNYQLVSGGPTGVRIVINIGPLPVGATTSANVILQMNAPAGTTVVNSATSSGSSVDSNNRNNAAGVTVKISR